MRNGLTLSAALGAVLVAGSFLVAAPANAAGPTAFVRSGIGTQYNVTCASAGTCNTITTGTITIAFGRTGSTTSSLGIFYKVVNGTAVDGVDFNTPATGEEVIAVGQTTANLSIPLLDAGLFDASRSFTVQITGTTTPITITNSTATGLIQGGNIPSDCSFTYEGGLSLALTCTGRPPTQAWYLRVLCGEIHGVPNGVNGNEVTGEGTSTATCSVTIEASYLGIDP
jgi:subtilisin family serine protease